MRIGIMSWKIRWHRVTDFQSLKNDTFDHFIAPTCIIGCKLMTSSSETIKVSNRWLYSGITLGIVRLQSKHFLNWWRSKDHKDEELFEIKHISQETVDNNTDRFVCDPIGDKIAENRNPELILRLREEMKTLLKMTVLLCGNNLIRCPLSKLCRICSLSALWYDMRLMCLFENMVH